MNLSLGSVPPSRVSSIAVDDVPGLLIILSQGSDPLSMNDHYEKVFDAISTVHHNKNDKQASGAAPHVPGRQKKAPRLPFC